MQCLNSAANCRYYQQLIFETRLHVCVCVCACVRACVRVCLCVNVQHFPTTYLYRAERHEDWSLGEVFVDALEDFDGVVKVTGCHPLLLLHPGCGWHWGALLQGETMLAVEV